MGVGLGNVLSISHLVIVLIILFLIVFAIVRNSNKTKRKKIEELDQRIRRLEEKR